MKGKVILATSVNNLRYEMGGKVTLREDQTMSSVLENGNPLYIGLSKM